jgi:hypothetical protein
MGSFLETVETGNVEDIEKILSENKDLNIYVIVKGFRDSCTKGNHDMAKVLYRYINDTVTDSSKHQKQFYTIRMVALRQSCEAGHLAIAQWLMETFKKDDHYDIPAAEYELIMRVSKEPEIVAWWKTLESQIKDMNNWKQKIYPDDSD